VVSALTVPVSGGAGLAPTITDTTKNQGAGDAAASTTTYYLSPDAALDASDVVLGRSLRPGARHGRVRHRIGDRHDSAGTATGTWYVYARRPTRVAG
jgi:hypothetical protein